MIRRGFCLALFFVFFFSTLSPAIEIPLEKHGEIYTLPVTVNGVITLNFILDTGASEVTLPSTVVSKLIRAGTVPDKDFLPGKSYRLADGSVLRSSRFRIKELNIQGFKFYDIPCSVSPVAGVPLLGQNFLTRMESWTVENRAHKLILNGPEAKQTDSAVYDYHVKPGKTATADTNLNPEALESTVTRKTGRPLLEPSAHFTNRLIRTNNTKPLISPIAEHDPIRKDVTDSSNE